MLPTTVPPATAAFSMPDGLRESYVTGVEDEAVNDGYIATTVDNIFNGSIVFWADFSPLRYDPANPDHYTPVVIHAQGEATPVVNNDINGDFEWDITNTNGTVIVMDKDVDVTAPATVQQIINGMDAYLTARVTTNDPVYTPSVQAILAMDVNRDQVISAGDISQINQRSVGARTSFYQVIGSDRDWLFLDPDILLTDLAYRFSTTWPNDDGVGYSKNRVPRPSQAFNVPVDPFGSSTCPVIEDKTYQAVMLGDADGTYKNFAWDELPEGLKSASSVEDKVKFELVKSASDVKVYVSFEAQTQVVALDASFLAPDAAMSSYEMIVEGMCFQNGDKVSCTSYSLNAYSQDEKVMAIKFKDADFEDIDVQLALINGAPVDYTVEVIEAPNALSDNEVSDVMVYPNPTNSILNVVVDGEATISVYNAIGQMIVSAETYEGLATFHVEDFAAGMYHVKVVQGTNVQVIAIVVE
jgi:hypothetical protein